MSGKVIAELARFVCEDEIHVLTHAMGASHGKLGWRNYFNAPPGHADRKHCESLVAKGLMECLSRSGDVDCFYVSDIGQMLVFSICGVPKKQKDRIELLADMADAAARRAESPQPLNQSLTELIHQIFRLAIDSIRVAGRKS